MSWLPWKTKKVKQRPPDPVAIDTDQQLTELEERVRLIKTQQSIMGRRWYDDPRRRYT